MFVSGRGGVGRRQPSQYAGNILRRHCLGQGVGNQAAEFQLAEGSSSPLLAASDRAVVKAGSGVTRQNRCTTSCPPLVLQRGLLQSSTLGPSAF